MTDMSEFEAQLERRLRVHAAVANRPFDAMTLAREAAGGTGPGEGRRVPLRAIVAARPALAWLLLIGFLVAMLGGVIIGALLLRGPDRPLGLLAIGYRNGLVIAHANGSDPRWIRTGGPYSNPRWSMDGAYLAASTVTDTDANVLRIMRSDGTVVGDVPRVFDYRWSPVRDEIAISVVGPFESGILHPHTVRPPAAGEHGVAIVGLSPPTDGSAIVAADGLSRLVVERLESTTYARKAFDPATALAWRRDGSELDFAFVFPDSREPRLQMADISGGGSSSFSGISEGVTGEVLSAARAPDDHLAVIMRRCAGSTTVQGPCESRLFTSTTRYPYSTGNAGFVEATSLAADHGTVPGWSVDGRWILFAADGDIALAAADGSGVTRLTTGPVTDSQAAWSPEGDQILFSRQRPTGDSTGSVLDLWAMGPDGSGQVLLARDAYGAEWQPTPRNIRTP